MSLALFPKRPAAGTLVFARVYDAPTVAEAAFYADTSLATVPAGGSSLALDFGPLRPLDPGDDDGDGLNNSWERALGTADRPTADYDDDGMLDLHVMLAGTDPTDAASLLEVRGAWSETNVPGYDPLARMLAHSETFRAMAGRIKALADELCGGRLLAAHEGGYAEGYVPFCGLAVIESGETLEGAQRFKDGEGRHGRFE